MAQDFPIYLLSLLPLKLDPAVTALTSEQKAALEHNIEVCRDAIVFFTAIAGAKGLGGHTGGPYDTVPEVLIARAFMAGGSPICRSALMRRASVASDCWPCSMVNCRSRNSFTTASSTKGCRGIRSSALSRAEIFLRPFGPPVGVLQWHCVRQPGKAVVVFGSDGSQMEGDDAEAARLAVAQKLNVKVIVDLNDVTIAGYPSKYLHGYDVGKTLAGHGLTVDVGPAEDLDSLYARMARAFSTSGPVALINKRKMAAGIDGLEGSNLGARCDQDQPGHRVP